jgi:hypothetical protein
MPLGPGVYDELCTAVREHTNADGVILIIIRGDQGGGFSCQATLEIQLALPEILRTVANGIEIDLGGPQHTQ